MKRATFILTLGFLIVPLAVQARNLGLLVVPIHQGKFTSSLLYEHLKVREDFDSRGVADFRSHVVGSHFSYGLSDQIAVAIKGGVTVDHSEEAQGSRWEGRAGYLYGLDLINEVFPPTDVKPGLQLSGGISNFQIPLNRIVSGSGVTLVDQKISGIEYHGALVATSRVGKGSPYMGVRVYGSKVHWRDNQPTASSPSKISGHSKGNYSLVVGVPVQLTPDLRFQAEGVFLNQTMLTAGFTLAVF